MADPAIDGRRMVQVSYPLDADLPLAHAVNFVHFSQAGLDVLMSLGQVDLAKMGAEPADDHGRVNMTAEISHRFLMSLGTLVQLRALLNQLADGMEAQGVRLPDSTLVEEP